MPNQLWIGVVVHPIADQMTQNAQRHFRSKGGDPGFRSFGACASVHYIQLFGAFCHFAGATPLIVSVRQPRPCS